MRIARVISLAIVVVLGACTDAHSPKDVIVDSSDAGPSSSAAAPSPATP